METYTETNHTCTVKMAVTYMPIVVRSTCTCNPPCERLYKSSKGQLKSLYLVPPPQAVQNCQLLYLQEVRWQGHWWAGRETVQCVSTQQAPN